MNKNYTDEVEASFRVPKRLLFIDDNADELALFLQLTKPFNCVVDVCTNGADGVPIAMQGSYDMIFVDMRMDGMDGCDVVERIKTMKRASGQRQYIALMSGAWVLEMPSRLAQCGFVAFIYKPNCFTAEFFEDMLGTFGIDLLPLC